jgi:F-type H+-transporting ATPase subunit delta
MIEGSLGRRYTKALFELAKETGREEAIAGEIELFLTIYSGSRLEAVLNNPAFELNGRKKILLEVTHKLQLSPVSMHFLALLLERDRLAYLPSIVATYRQMVNQSRGRIEAKVVASRSLDATLLERLSAALQRISGKEILLRQEADPTVIGGLLLELEGTIYDGTVRSQLAKMKQRIARER